MKQIHVNAAAFVYSETALLIEIVKFCDESTELIVILLSAAVNCTFKCKC